MKIVKRGFVPTLKVEKNYCLYIKVEKYDKKKKNEKVIEGRFWGTIVHFHMQGIDYMLYDLLIIKKIF